MPVASFGDSAGFASIPIGSAREGRRDQHDRRRRTRAAIAFLGPASTGRALRHSPAAGTSAPRSMRATVLASYRFPPLFGGGRHDTRRPRREQDWHSGNAGSSTPRVFAVRPLSTPSARSTASATCGSRSLVERRAGHAQAQRGRGVQERARRNRARPPGCSRCRADRSRPCACSMSAASATDPAHRAHVVERHAERDDAPYARQPVGRLQADDAAVGGRNAHRSAGIGPQRAGAQARRDGRAGTARRPAGDAVHVSHGLRTGPVWVKADVAP